MEISINPRDGIKVIQISGNLDGNSAHQAKEKIIPLIVPDCRLILDLVQCPYISSAGLRLLLMAAKQISANDGRFFLSGLSDEVKDVMEITGFSHFFTVYDKLSDAIKDMKSKKMSGKHESKD